MDVAAVPPAQYAGLMETKWQSMSFLLPLGLL